MKQSEKWWVFIGGKVSFVGNEKGEETTLNPLFCKSIMVTDSEIGATFTRTDDDARIQIDANTVLFELEFDGVIRMAMIHLGGDANILMWFSEEDSGIYKDVIKAHNDYRSQEIQHHFFNTSLLVESNRDFITIYNDTPSITSQVPAMAMS